MTHKKRWIWGFVAVGAAVVIVLALFASAFPLRSDTLKRRIVETLSERLNSNVTLEDISLRLYPRLRAEGKGLTIRDRRRPDVPPLIAIKSFTIHADLVGAWRKRVSRVELRGLEISIPPDDDTPEEDAAEELRKRAKEPHHLHEKGTVATSGQTPTTTPAGGKPKTDPAAIEDGVVIDTLLSENAKLIIIPRKAGKQPKTWDIHELRMHNVGVDSAMPFTATVTNAVPPGEIYAKGGFGPWDSNQPGNTPLDGTFTFDNASLDVFEGIGGTLSSRGSFGGSLDYIDVNGETETSDFVVKVGGQPFPMTTQYHAVVDGTNGDTLLEDIDARFLQTRLQASGAVLDGPPGQHGRTVQLDVTIPNGRIEDVLKMAVKQKTPPMVGALTLTTKFLLPPGHSDVVDRLRLNGRFSLTNATFTNRDVQRKIVELSKRGSGKKDAVAGEDSVASEFRGQFALGDGRLDLRSLRFAVPGAQVQLAGNYGLKQEELAFTGNLLIDAKISETVSGWKSVLLKIADPIFKKEGGGSSIPIKIEGTREEPKFGLDMSRVFKRGN